MKRLTVADVMRHEVVTVGEDTDFQRIADLLVSHAISAVPVLDLDGRVVGVVSEADLLGRLEYADRVPHHPLGARRMRSGRRGSAANTAADVMSKPPVTIRAEASVSGAARLMDAARVKRLPVVDTDDRLIGIVSRRDLLRLYARADADIEIALGSDLADLGIDVSGMTLSVSRGVVTVGGRLAQDGYAEIIVRLIASVPGVVDVVNTIKIADVSAA
jgi:CBS domain-containing protein